MVAAIVAIPLFVVFLSSVVRPLGLDSWWIGELDSRCENLGFACNALTEVLGLVFAISAGFLIFLALRLSRVKKRYIKEIRNHPESLFPSWTCKREIVGRDALCGLIDDDFTLNGFLAAKRNERHRRPRIIVGDIGSGKTGVLVRLAQLLAQRGAVPVPVRLRAADGEVDFVELAREEFARRTERFVLVEDEGDRIWRWLLETGSIVILADGLEEALLGSRARETRIRAAIEEAMTNDNVPIVISARPAPYLATLDAALIRLEPLPMEDAVDALTGVLGDGGKAETLLQDADVGTMPFALELLRELAEENQLDGLGRLTGVRLRLELLDRWLLLKTQQSRPWRALSEPSRAAAMHALEGLAALGLQQDSLMVASTTLTSSRWRDELVRSDDPNAELAARLAAAIHLVEDVAEGVRFKNNLVQAYFGSRALRRVLTPTTADEFLDEVEAEPGRELLMAIVFACAGGLDGPTIERVQSWLVTRSEEGALRDDVRLAMLAAAAEIQQFVSSDSACSIPDVVSHRWPADRRRDEQRDDAKRRCLRRLGQLRCDCAFTALWDVCRNDEDPAMQFAAGLAIAEGGDGAYEALRDRFQAGDRLAATLAPSLAHHCTDGSTVEQLCTLIEGWAGGSAHDASVHQGLAAGLRWQANHRRSEPATRERLITSARTMLASSDWWSTLALMQALTLWQLSNSERRAIRPGPVIAGWLEHNEARDHQFVRAARSLCCCTLRTREPSRFLWIDESLSIRRIGSGATHPTRNLWLAPTGGWLSLDPRAQQLLADVVLLVNLTRSLGSSAALPQCLTSAAHRSAVLAPGVCCGAGDCASRGDEVPLLGDISASFARSQQRIHARRLARRRSRAPWQQGRRRQYHKAWVEAARAAPE